MTAFDERRRSPRVPVQHHAVSVATTTRVRVVDISLGGVLMASNVGIPVTAATLTVPLPGGRVRSRVEIRHQSSADAGLVHLGAAFLEMNRESHRSLEQFLAKTTR